MTAKKTETRLKVERTMAAAPVGHPLTAQQISERCGVSLHLARHYIGRLIEAGLVRNVGSRATSAYVWRGNEPQEQRPAINTPREAPAPGYTGEKATHYRPAGDTAFTLPSVENGKHVERKRPLIVAARVEAVGGHGGWR